MTNGADRTELADPAIGEAERDPKPADAEPGRPPAPNDGELTLTDLDGVAGGRQKGGPLRGPGEQNVH